MAYRNFASLLINEVTWKDIFSKLNCFQEEIHADKLAYLPHFRYPCKKPFLNLLPSESETEQSLQLEFKVTKLVGFSKTVHVELTDKDFVLMIQITRITKKHAKIQFYFDSQRTMKSQRLKKIVKELLCQIYVRDWHQVLKSDLKQLKQSKSPIKANLNGIGRELTPDFKAHVSKTGHMLEGANNK